MGRHRSRSACPPGHPVPAGAAFTAILIGVTGVSDKDLTVPSSLPGWHAWLASRLLRRAGRAAACQPPPCTQAHAVPAAASAAGHRTRRCTRREGAVRSGSMRLLSPLQGPADPVRTAVEGALLDAPSAPASGAGPASGWRASSKRRLPLIYTHTSSFAWAGRRGAAFGSREGRPPGLPRDSRTCMAGATGAGLSVPRSASAGPSAALRGQTGGPAVRHQRWGPPAPCLPTESARVAPLSLRL